MAILVLGLVIFLGLHSIRIFAAPLRAQAIARLGEGPWKGIYSLLSAISFVLIVWGFAQARFNAPTLWAPPSGARHVTILLMLVSMLLFAGYFFKQSHIAVAVHHPMVWSVAVFGLAHLIANGSAADLVLFGAFLHLGVGRPHEFIRPGPPEQRHLSRAELGRDDGRDCSRPRALGRDRLLAAFLALRRLASSGIERRAALDHAQGA